MRTPRLFKNRYENREAFTKLVNWTNGCFTLKNIQMDCVWDAFNIGTPIEIRPFSIP